MLSRGLFLLGIPKKDSRISIRLTSEPSGGAKEADGAAAKAPSERRSRLGTW